jgi:WhiB family redox-sensing transcriptional regulator
VKFKSDWKDYALCTSGYPVNYWFSNKKPEIDVAKSICAKCTVRLECFTTAWSDDSHYGVYGGVSEYEYLLLTWKEAKSESESNRDRTDKRLRKILQEIA